MTRALQKVRMQAFYCALAAKAGVLEAGDTDLLILLSADLDEDDPLRTDIARFAGVVRQRRGTPQARAAAGDDLHHAVQRSTWATPDQNRKDIHG